MPPRTNSVRPIQPFAATHDVHQKRYAHAESFCFFGLDFGKIEEPQRLRYKGGAMFQGVQPVERVHGTQIQLPKLEISLWSVRDRELRKVICHDGVRSVQFMADGQLVTGSLNPNHFITTILNPTTGQIMTRVRTSGIRFSPSGELFATLSMVPRHTKLIRHRRGYLQAERTPTVAGIDLWDTRTGRKLVELPHESSIDVVFSPDGRLLASVGPERIKLWRVAEFLRRDVE